MNTVEINVANGVELMSWRIVRHMRVPALLGFLFLFYKDFKGVCCRGVRKRLYEVKGLPSKILWKHQKQMDLYKWKTFNEKSGKNIVAKGKISHEQDKFLLLPKCFQKISAPEVWESVCMFERVTVPRYKVFCFLVQIW